MLKAALMYRAVRSAALQPAHLREHTVQHVLILFELQQLTLQTLEVGAPVPSASSFPVLPLQHLRCGLVSHNTISNSNTEDEWIYQTVQLHYLRSSGWG